MMPSGAGASANPYEHYDRDTIEEDLIDPDDGIHKAHHTVDCFHANLIKPPWMISTTRSAKPQIELL